FVRSVRQTDVAHRHMRVVVVMVPRPPAHDAVWMRPRDGHRRPHSGLRGGYGAQHPGQGQQARYGDSDGSGHARSPVHGWLQFSVSASDCAISAFTSDIHPSGRMPSWYWMNTRSVETCAAVPARIWEPRLAASSLIDALSLPKSESTESP